MERDGEREGEGRGKERRDRGTKGGETEKVREGGGRDHAYEMKKL